MASIHAELIRDVPRAAGCVESLEADGWWVHLRRCAICGHVGCCDSSPRGRAGTEARKARHPVMKFYGPGEQRLYCYVDEVDFEVPSPAPEPSPLAGAPRARCLEAWGSD